MTKQETVKILSVLKTVYPQQFDGTDSRLLVEIWHDSLSDLSYLDIDKAVRAYISTNNNNFAPSIGKVRSLVVKMNQPEVGRMTAQEAASLIQKAVSNSGYNSREEFAKLPKTIQRIVRDPKVLFDWSQMPIETFQSVILSNFQRSFKVAAEQDFEDAKLPEDLKPLPDGQTNDGVFLTSDAMKELTDRLEF